MDHGRLGGQDTKLRFGAKTATPFLSLRPSPLPLRLAYGRGGGAEAARVNNDGLRAKQQRELSRQPADKILSAARKRVRSPGCFSHGDRLPSQDGRHLCRE